MRRRGFVADLRVVLRGSGFRRLFAVRLTSQFGDGVLNVALASFVFFSPERAADAPTAAAALAALLLPYSLVGPFAGVLLDRWRRRQVLLAATLVRSALVLAVDAFVGAELVGMPLYLTALAAIGVNRFFLAGLGASLPHVVPDDELVMANAVSPTAGTLVALAGAATGFLVRAWSGGTDAGAAAEVVVLVFAAACYLVAATLSLRLRPDALGPDYDPDRPAVREAARHVAVGFAAGMRHVAARRPAAFGLLVIGAHRFAYGVTTVATILLYRNYFNSPEDVDAGLAGLATAFVSAGVGFGVAAVITPIATRHLTAERWIFVLLLLAAVVGVVPGMLFTTWSMMAAAAMLGVSAQGIKICVDALVQWHIDDAFRGRVFALYDMLFNVVFVAAGAFAALTLPASGKSYGVAAFVAGLYLVTALGYAATLRRSRTYVQAHVWTDAR